MIRTRASLVVVMGILVFASVAARADSPHRPRQPHIRTTDPRLIRLLRDGEQTSDTFRRLVERLAQSDVVVYLECAGVRTEGRLAFVSSVAGYRYLHVRVGRLASRDAQIALIGHELQHAVEIADAPQVVDERSLEREYRRIGFQNARIVTTGLAFDSAAAIHAGYQVLRELSGSAGD